MSTKEPSQRWNDGLRLVSYCPVCETPYNPMEAKMLGEDGETRLLHVQCRKCQNSLLALVLVNHVGASSVGLLTDLSYEDVLKFQADRHVTINDVIDIHKVMENDRWQSALGVRSRRTAVRRKEKRHI
ncbi:MAG: hypothetical protein AAB431_03820 [Patescibacteria group bacterium]